MRIKLAPAFFMTLALFATTARALESGKPTDAEMATLPPYCPSRFRGPSDEHFKDWMNTIGPIFEHIHHYCGALVALSRYNRSNDPQDRRYLLGEVLSNIEYVTKITSVQNSALMPEIYITKGRVLLRAHRDAEAVNVFLSAIQLKPDYAPPYLAMADYYAGIKKKQDALKFLQEGLRQIPTSKSLVRRYQELGGKLPFPGSLPAVTEAPKPEPQLPVPAGTGKKTVEAAPVAVPQTLNKEQASPSETLPKKIGRPSNPWCRFCTDDEPAPATK